MDFAIRIKPGILRRLSLSALLYLFSGVLTLVQAQAEREFSLPPGFGTDRFVEDIIIVKVGSPSVPSANARISSDARELIEQAASLTGALEVTPAFPSIDHSAARVHIDSRVRELSGVFKLRLPPGADLIQEINRLLRLDYVVYAEPYYRNELLYVPNDPQANPNGGAQDYLVLQKVHSAWDHSMGDSTIVIGIVDTGVQMQHPDLKDNIALNLADPINGIDDDGDGYIDNYYGWDLADNDNDPNADNSGHGSFVTGLSSARANNNLGMAGIGLKSKFLPVKVSASANNYLINEYEGIIYAADRGCKVINLSWGGVYPYFQYGQDVINYAVLYRDAVVVAAAGNTPKDLVFYPASFDNVLSVGATNKDDTKASWATWSYFIDLMAPGNNVYTTNNNSGYSGGYGSSFSAPQASGAAALVRARFPNLNARQVMEQLRITADDIYGVGNNMQYYGQMGRGRLNALRAVTDQLTPSVRMTKMLYKGSYDQYIFHSDTLLISGEFTNFLRYAKNAVVNISSETPGVNVVNGRFLLGNMAEMIASVNATDPFMVQLGKDHDPGKRLVFRLDMEAEDYRDFQYFTLFTTPDYFPVSTNSVTLTVASDGDLAYNRDSLREGTGVYALGQYLAHWIGLVVSADSTSVADNAVNNFQEYTREKDFEVVEHARLYKNSRADLDARSIFRTSNAVPEIPNVEIEQKILGWNESADGDYVVLEYRVSNTGEAPVNSLNVGLFADWNIRQFDRNEADWDETSQIGFVFEKSAPDLMAGISMLTEGQISYHAIDKGGFGGNAAELDAIFTDAQKHRFLSRGVVKSSAGVLGTGNDVAQMIGRNGIDLKPGESQKIAFVLLFGSSLEQLRAQKQSAKARFQDYLLHPPLESLVEVCQGDSAVIDPGWGDIFEFYSDVALTERLDSGAVYKTPPVNIDYSVYAVNLDRGYRSDTRRIQVMIATPEASFEGAEDTLFIEQGGYTTIQFDNTSSFGETWLWDFGNGYNSKVKSPSTVYNREGEYGVSLTVFNRLGCSDNSQRVLMVAYRSPRPVLSDQVVCANTSTLISASNTREIRVYADQETNSLLFEGEEWTSPVLQSDTVYYVTNIEGYESLPSAVRIYLEKPSTGIVATLDTSDLSKKHLVVIKPQSENYQSVKWYIGSHYAGNGEEIYYDYQGNSFTVAQVMTDLSGCMDSLVRVFVPGTSPAPFHDDIQVCRGEEVVLRPSNGSLFYFYADAGRNQLLHKGREYVSKPVEGGIDYFITSMDNWLEGSSRTVRVSVTALKADFSMDPDTLNLQYDNQVELRNTSTGASWAYWHLPSGATDIREIIYPTFNQPGNYTFELVAGDDDGCVHRVSKTTIVLSVTGLAHDSRREQLVIFPNPAAEQLYFNRPDKSASWQAEIYDPAGRRLWWGTPAMPEGSPGLIDVSLLPAGLYILKLFDRDIVYSGKFFKQ